MKTEEHSETEPRVAADADDERERIRRGLRHCLWVFLGMRVGLTLIALAGVALLPTLDPVSVQGWPAHETTHGWHNLVTAWERFDALWFLRIADTGYYLSDKSAVFFPGYPLAIRYLSPLLGGHLLAGGLLISNLATFGSLVILYFLTASEFDERIARRTVIYLAVFPTSFFLVAPYSESLFLFLVVLALWAARRNRWEVAGLAGIGASVTRNIGVLLVLPLAVEAVHGFLNRREQKDLWRGLIWAGIAAGGAVGYLLFCHTFYGDWAAPLHQQDNWQRVGSFPLGTVLQGSQEAFRFIGVYPGGYHLLDWLIVMPALVGVGWVVLRTRPIFSVYTVVSLLAPLSYAFLPRPFMSIPRFLLPLFPLIWAVAVWSTRKKGIHEVYLGFSGALLGIMLVLFVNWYYVF